MRKRFQKGNVRKVHGSWIGRWWEDGQRKYEKLGRVSEMTKSQAKEKLMEKLRAINARPDLNLNTSFGDFVQDVFFPLYRRKWKRSTKMTTEDRIEFHLVGQFKERSLTDILREELQSFLDAKASALSFSTVDHLKWDLIAIFRMAVSEGYARRNPAELLFTPRECKKGDGRVMNIKEVNELFKSLELRERLIVKFAVLGGMRPGEIFALRRGYVTTTYADVSQRVYRGDLDTPKTRKSVRLAALSGGLARDLADWLRKSPDTGPNGWLFPSEKLDKPIWKDGVWRRHVRPKLKDNKLEWVNFQVLRRTHSSLMRDKNVDPKVVADQLGHTLDVNLNVYTQTSLERKIEAVETLESSLVN
jgi:integrase